MAEKQSQQSLKVSQEELWWWKQGCVQTSTHACIIFKVCQSKYLHHDVMAYTLLRGIREGAGLGLQRIREGARLGLQQDRHL
eukprot:1159743-Pelagomonas_calceolata.AAC.5